MNISLDQSTDFSGRELYTILNGINTPEFVKNASVDTQEDLRPLSKEAFADTYNKAFPINSAERVYLSNAYFINKKADLQHRWGENYVKNIESRITKAAEAFGISKDIDSFNVQTATKMAKDYTQDYVYSAKIGDKEFLYFPVKTAADFTKAADVFSKKIAEYPFSWRKEMAEAFVKKAMTFGLDEVPDIICKYAGMFYPDNEEINRQLWYRSTKIADENIRKNYLDTFTKIAKDITTKEDVFKLAEEVFAVESECGLYDNVKTAMYLKDPVDAFFAMSIEKVAEVFDVVEMAGRYYPVGTLQKISSDIYKEAFGVDIDPSDASQLRDILPTMPLSDVSLFRELSGVSPI
jgi:hypothetical protein